jgi:hypothetical protein
LSGDDDIVNAELVFDYLKNYSHKTRKVFLLPGLKHGQMVFVPQEAKKIYNDIAGFI